MVLSAMRALLIFFLVALTQLAVVAPAAAETPQDPRVPLVALIANPEAYDGRYVEVTGYLNLEFEGNGLFVSKADFDAYITQNAVWIDGPRDKAVRRALTRHYVTASGIFRAGDHGSYNAYRGKLVVDHAAISGERRQLSYLYATALSAVPLPWLLIIPLLAFAAIAMGAVRLLRRAAASDGSAGAVRFVKPGSRGQSRSWMILVVVFSLFTLLTAGSGARVAYLVIGYHGPFDIWFGLMLGGAIVGVLAAAAMWACHVKGRRTLCAAFMILQLAVPATRELLRQDTWQAQMAYPFQPWVTVYSWSRPGAAAPHP